jgi:predicted nuclease of predicted toxin-antitoxin system
VDAFSARDISKLGMTDEEQLEVAAQYGAVIFTHDSDFLRLALCRGHSGVVFVHRQKYTVGECIRKLKIIAETRSSQEMLNQIVFL